MEDYIKPALRENPDHIILHIGTNELSTDKPPDVIANEIIDFSTRMKNQHCEVSISNITTRNDKWKEKAEETNDH